ncbi:hypothetical protein B0J14DRAFT_578192 [Halenospora varia]|nr:hypothetical protein B0J14DRAFT_578192 [Halenospora varia]
MQLTTLLLALLPAALVSSTACVAGGPADRITAVKICCYNQAGTWYQFYPNQAICVIADSRNWAYNQCVDRVGYGQLDTRCIPGQGEGLSSQFGTATATGRTTITALAAEATAA